MLKYEDECCGCGLPCLGETCPNRQVMRWYCDECGEETDPTRLYKIDDNEYCANCALGKLETVMTW